MARPVSNVSPNVIVRMDHEDKKILNQLIAFEKLTRSDVIRRAIRAYAKQLGVSQQDKVA
jgi:metal-responsive CopG/Arc/MetJ family transcriptional regulator